MGNNQAQEFSYGTWRTDIPQLPGHSPELICAKNAASPESLAVGNYKGFTELLSAFRDTVKRFPDNRFLGTRAKDGEREYEWKTFFQVNDLMEKFARGLESLGMVPVEVVDGQRYKFLGIFSKNREEWAIADLGCLRSAVTIVPFYESLGADATAFILNQTELSTLCVEGKFLDFIFKLKADQRCPYLKHIISFDPLTPEQRQTATQLALKAHTFQEVIYVGDSHPHTPIQSPEPSTVYMFCYTSGTTGDPKGVMLTHESFVSCLHFADWYNIDLNETDVTISYLPYGHTFEQCIFMLSVFRGFAHGYYSGDPLKLLEDIQVLKPTMFCTVPRILNRVYTKIQESLANKSAFAKWFFNHAVESKKYYYEKDGSLTHALYDRAIFAKIQQQFGGNVRFMLSASAPVSAEVLQFYKLALGIHVYEVYGQTETNGPATCSHPSDIRGGSVGGVMPSLRIRLRDVPELGYLSTDQPYPRGEVQFKGTNVFKGYFKNPERTQEAFSEDGWLNSGDVGLVLPNGAIKIIDRAKNIFKLSQGEYIAPEKLENIYTQCPIIQQIFVYGDSLQSTLVAIIVPDLIQLKAFAEANGLTQQQALESETLKQQIVRDMDAKAREYQLTSLEKIKKISLTDMVFTQDNDIITPTFKLKRNVAKRVFQEAIDKMYADAQ
ncbi:hypothetical protein FGO68_gene5718 [Halteria grandinella]|uniref:AMP-dependent synthetase/ligase domain-containing protein n=1 Tax=Halteria grandinella TaxID=5974 RepID=A0A8J8NXN9_HALGN|nr:hypothetical protein FGO68_gene5718 [Halteria grandinella]